MSDIISLIQNAWVLLKYCICKCEERSADIVHQVQTVILIFANERMLDASCGFPWWGEERCNGDLLWVKRIYFWFWQLLHGISSTGCHSHCHSLQPLCTSDEKPLQGSLNWISAFLTTGWATSWLIFFWKKKFLSNKDVSRVNGLGSVGIYVTSSGNYIWWIIIHSACNIWYLQESNHHGSLSCWLLWSEWMEHQWLALHQGHVTYATTVYKFQ